jgi:hypothetical protein
MGAVRSVAAALLAVLLTGTLGRAATFYVDRGCAASGLGTSVDCGVNGPFQTPGEALAAASALAPPHTINIRGSHAPHPNCLGHSGVYFNSLWMIEPIPAGIPHGGDLPCTVANPCVVQGYQTERPIIQGGRIITNGSTASDWTIFSGAGGADANTVWRRTMEQFPSGTDDCGDQTATSGGARDEWDPMLLIQNDLPMPYHNTGGTCGGGGTGFNPTDCDDGVLGTCSHDGGSCDCHAHCGDNATDPADGKWNFTPSTHHVYVNPTGTGDPRSTILVPHHTRILCLGPTTDNVTFRQLQFEGSRYTGADIGDAGSTSQAQNIVLDDVRIRHFPRYGVLGQNTPNLVIEDSLVEYGGRGYSFSTPSGDASFAIRLFNAPGLRLSRNNTRRMGAAGVVRYAGGNARFCSWCGSPFNDATGATGTRNATTGLGIQLKQTDGALIEDNQSSDLFSGGVSIDVSRNVIVEDNTITNTGVCLSQQNFTPTGGCPTSSTSEFCYNHNNIFRGNHCIDTGVDGLQFCAAGIQQNDSSAWHTGGTFGVRVYNNEFIRPGFAAICLLDDDTEPSDSLIANNSMAGCRSTGDVDALCRGIIIAAASSTGSDVIVRNNVIDTTASGTDEPITVCSAAVGDVSLDFDLVNDTGANCSGSASTHTPAVRWGATCSTSQQPSGGTCYLNLDDFAAVEGFETNSVTGNPLFVDANSDLRITQFSAARDMGQTRAEFSTDAYGAGRPIGPSWDIGIHEFSSGATTTSTVVTTTSTVVTTTSTAVTTTSTAITTTSTVVTTTSTIATTTSTAVGGSTTTSTVDPNTCLPRDARSPTPLRCCTRAFQLGTNRCQ